MMVHKTVMMAMMMMIMQSVMAKEVAGVDLNAKEGQIQPPQEILKWILQQAVKPWYNAEGTWHTGTVLEWHQYFQSYTAEQWASWMSSQNGVGGRYQPEQWLEWWSTEEGRPEHALIHTLVELQEHALIKILRESIKQVTLQKRLQRERHRYAPY